LSLGVLAQFRVLYNISVLSESFIQLMVIMELRCSEDYARFISQAIIEGYLKVFMNRVQQRPDSTDLDITDYEKSVFKEMFFLFIEHYRQRVHNDPPWFPSTGPNLPTINGVFDTICALLHLKICMNDAAIKTHLTKTIEMRLHTDIADAFARHSNLFDETTEFQFTAAEDFRKFVEQLAISMNWLTEYNKLFSLFDVPYTRICFFDANGAADRLAESTKCLITMMTDYFKTYTKPSIKANTSMYDANLIQSSGLLLKLYQNLQLIVNSLNSSMGKRDWETNAFKFTLNEYHRWYTPIMKYLIDGFVADIRKAIERAVEIDTDNIIEEKSVHYSFSSITAVRFCASVCRNWELLDYPDANVRYTAMFKLTECICSQAKYYARYTAKKLSENKYFTDLNRTVSFNVTKTLCTLVNDIYCLEKELLTSLPELLKFDSVIAKMAENYESDEFDQAILTLNRLIVSAKTEMTDVILLIFEHVTDLINASLQSKIATYYREEKRARPDCIGTVLTYLGEKLLKELYEGLIPDQYFRLACAIRLRTLRCFEAQLPLQERPEFYGRVLKSFDRVMESLNQVCRTDPSLPGSPCEEIPAFRRTLQIHALTTEDLQLVYFREICRNVSPLEYPKKNGEISYRVGYEIVNDLVTVSILIINCRNLPKMDYIGSCDPYVILELLPVSFYHKQQKESRTTVQKNTLNPDFHEVFHWHRLPSNVLTERGAVLRLSVWDQDIVQDDFIGECFISLPQIVSLKNLASLRDVPVAEQRLRQPIKSNQPQVFELIKNRANVDPPAAEFIKSRTSVMKSVETSNGASGVSDDRNSTGSYASAALRSLFCMLPFNLSSGQGLTNLSNRSETVDDNDDQVP